MSDEEPGVVRDKPVTIPLSGEERETLKGLARSRDLRVAQLVRLWIREEALRQAQAGRSEV